MIINAEDSELDWFLNESETFLKTVNEPELGYFLAESPNVIMRALKGGYEPVKCLVEAKADIPEFLSEDSFRGVPVYSADYEVLARMRGFEMTRGALCIMKRRALPDAGEILKGKKRVAILDRIMNPTNLGAVFRSAAALGVEAIFLSKGCADPLFKRACRVSMGTVFQVPWTYVDDVNELIDLLHANEFSVMALALDERAVSLGDSRLKENEKIAMVLGTEATGIKDEIIRACDYTVMIPMMNGVDSLNVAAAGAVAFWELR